MEQIEEITHKLMFCIFQCQVDLLFTTYICCFRIPVELQQTTEDLFF